MRGANGSGKSTLLTSLKAEVKTRAYYWPTADRLAFQFAQGEAEGRHRRGRRADSQAGKAARLFIGRTANARAAGDRRATPSAPIYLLDEWDANLDPNNRAAADALVEELARRARVVEISHRDRI